METNLISIVIPYHDMSAAGYFLKRNIDSIMNQSYKDYEIVLTKEGKMAENTNAGIKRAKGDLIKILYLDDYLAHEDSLKEIVENFKGEWLITGVNTNPNPRWTDDIATGNNKLGSPSALTIRNETPLLFDEQMSWLLDCDYYKRMNELYGPPQILAGENVIIGEGSHQMTYILTDEEKESEVNYLKQKYD